MSTFIAATEYAARAVLEVPKNHRKALQHINEPTAGDRIYGERFAQTLLHAQHFVLPDEGFLLDDDLKGLHHAEELHLPYPTISLAWRKGKGMCFVTIAKECTYGDVLSACELREYAKRPRAGFRTPGIFHDDWSGIWIQTALDTGSDEKRGFSPVPLGSFVMIDRIGTQTADSALKIATTLIWNSPAVVEKAIVGEKAYDYMMLSVQHAARSMLELLEALTCRNVHPVSNGEGSPSNVHRARNGKLPIFETKMLTVETVNMHASGSEDVHHIGRSGPRAHLRRGHIRRLETGNIWINSMIVAASNGGWIEKGYDVKGG